MASERNNRIPNLVRWVISISAGVIAFFVVQSYGDNSPLGAPLPAVPALIEYEGVEFKESSLVDGRLNERLLELMAPQSDGVPPLIRPYTSESAGFTIGHPYGTEMTIFMPNDFFEDGVLCQALIRHGMPIKAIKYGLPEKLEKDKVTVFVSKIRKELEAKGACFLAKQGVVELPDYRFETLEYERIDESGEKRTHFLFFGPFGPRVLVIDFVALENQHALAKPYAHKIIHSFQPGEQLLSLLTELSDAEAANIDEGTEGFRSGVDDKEE